MLAQMLPCSYIVLQDGSTPLLVAAKFNQLECVRLLLSAGAAVDGPGAAVVRPVAVLIAL